MCKGLFFTLLFYCFTTESAGTVCSPQPACDARVKYRSYSGWCNNLAKPGLTKAFGGFIRVVANGYNDGERTPRSVSALGGPLPNPRAVSNAIHSQNKSGNARHSHMLMQWGQFVAHDLISTVPSTDSTGVPINCTMCNSNTNHPDCLPIALPLNEHHYTATYPPDSPEQGQAKCLPFVRAKASSTTGQRNQINQNSPWLDGSAVYGSDQCRANSLRTNVSGLLITTPNIMSTNPAALPQGKQMGFCRSDYNRHYCFVAGDQRNYEQPGLQVPHTAFVREHNRIAARFKQITSWTDEQIYQEARRIVIAEIQHVTYNEYLRRVLGNRLWTANNFSPHATGYHTGYQPCDGSILLAFSHAAYRIGHSMVRDSFPRLNNAYQRVTDDTWLGREFFSANAIYNETSGGVNTLAMGLVGHPAMAVERGISNSVRNYLNSILGQDWTGSDLAATNIMRGRDVGLQGYNAYRVFCGLPKATSFSTLNSYMSAPTVAALQGVYASVDDIDLWTGVLSEDHVPDGIVGPTAACLIVRQFANLKRCDRFFYESNNTAAPAPMFTPAQLDNIRKITLSSIMCNNFIQVRFQPWAFDLPGKSNDPNTACRSLPQLDLTLFATTGTG